MSSYITLDSSTREVYLNSNIESQQANEALIGDHTIIVTASIDVIDDYPNHSSTTRYTQTTSFVLTVQPCHTDVTNFSMEFVSGSIFDYTLADDVDPDFKNYGSYTMTDT